MKKRQTKKQTLTWREHSALVRDHNRLVRIKQTLREHIACLREELNSQKRYPPLVLEGARILHRLYPEHPGQDFDFLLRALDADISAGSLRRGPGDLAELRDLKSRAEAAEATVKAVDAGALEQSATAAVFGALMLRLFQPGEIMARIREGLALRDMRLGQRRD
jgi:hypothetical protein